MERLAHVWRQNKVILILLVGIVNAKALTRRVSKSCDNVVLDYLRAFICLIFFYTERAVRSVLNTVVVVDPLVRKALWLWDLPSGYQALHRA